MDFYKLQGTITSFLAILILLQSLIDQNRELGVAIVAYSPLGRGFLSGRFKSIEDLDLNDYRRTHPRYILSHSLWN